MIDILFKGKTDSGIWVFGDLRHLDNGQFGIVEHKQFAPTGSLVLPETIGQFTGLTDKNHTKIFGGDRFLDGNDMECKIEWDDDRAGFMVWCLESEPVKGQEKQWMPHPDYENGDALFLKEDAAKHWEIIPSA